MRLYFQPVTTAFAAQRLLRRCLHSFCALLLIPALVFLCTARGTDYSNRTSPSLNIVYVKVTKVGGSTVGGVVRRICDHCGLSGCRDSLFIRDEPGVWANHRHMSELLPSIRKLQQPVFLMTWLRDPVERAMSKFYHFEVSRRNTSMSVEAKLMFLQNLNPNEQSHYISTIDSSSISTSTNRSDPLPRAADIAAVFDFIGVTERFDESMLLLAQRLNLSLCDILYLRAKDSHSGAVDDIGARFVPHVLLHEEPAEVRRYLQSREFNSKNAADAELLKLVHTSIDAAIDGSGSGAFAAALGVYRAALAAAAALCPAAISPRSCYWNDNGCGFRCLDHFCAAFPAHMQSTYPFAPAARTAAAYNSNGTCDEGRSQQLNTAHAARLYRAAAEGGESR